MPDKITSDKEVQIYELFHKGWRLKHIADHLGINETTVGRYLHRQGIRAGRIGRPRILSEETRQRLATRYDSGEMTISLVKEYGVSHQSIVRYVREQGVSTRKPGQSPHRYVCNETFFHSIDNEAKAYWLGFIAADGCVTDNGRLIIGLSPKDRHHLEQLKAALESTHQVVDRKVDEATGKALASTLEIWSPSMVQDLKLVGIHPRKTDSLEFANLQPLLMPHYIRGLIDGDGGFYSYVYYYSDRIGPLTQQSVSITSHRTFLRDLQSWFEDILRVKHVKLIDVTKSGQYCILKYSNLRDVLAVANYLYEGATVFLPRKRDTVLNHYRVLPKYRDQLRFG